MSLLPSDPNPQHKSFKEKFTKEEFKKDWKNNKGRYITFIVIVLIFIWYRRPSTQAYFKAKDMEKQKKEMEQKQFGEEQREKRTIKVSAVQILNDYRSNEVAADNIYKGKEIRVFGYVRSITKDFEDNVIVILQVETLSDVWCYIDKTHVKYASKLVIGDKIALDGTGAGMVLTNVIIKNCEFK